MVARPVAPAAAAPAPTTPRVVVYGDSLTWEARDFVAWLGAVNGMQVEVRSFGGTAICDWLREARATLPAIHPGAVVWAFSGNNLTPCMRTGGRALVADRLERKYERDASTAMMLSRRAGANVVLVGPPRSFVARHDPHWQRISDAYRHVATRHAAHVAYADGGRLIAPGGEWRSTQSCLAREQGIVDRDGTRPCRNGRIVVRAPDGAHFCPGGAAAVNGVTTYCPRYSSGAFRYASTIVREAHHAVYGTYP